MKCPCDDTVLQRVEALGLELDKCHKCDGIWFDHGELNAIVGEKATLEKIKDPGPLHAFVGAMARLLGRA